MEKAGETSAAQRLGRGLRNGWLSSGHAYLGHAIVVPDLYASVILSAQSFSI